MRDIKHKIIVIVLVYTLLNIAGIPIFKHYYQRSNIVAKSRDVNASRPTSVEASPTRPGSFVDRALVPTSATTSTTAKQDTKPAKRVRAPHVIRRNGRKREDEKHEPTQKEIRAQKEKDEEAIATYLQTHKQGCLIKWTNNDLKEGAKPLCDCVPDTLVGFRNVSLEKASFNKTLEENPDIQPGGHWEPKHCTARYKVVIVVPYRDREYHLSVLLKYLHPVLRGQQLNYTVVVVEQNQPSLFNKAALMNIGFMYAKEMYQPDCVIFHDVDMIPQDGRHFYTCRRNPLHLGAFHSRHNYRIIYRNIFGAVTSFRTVTFEQVNGFSNRFFGWGGEDDEMSNRLHDLNKRIERDPRPVAGYTAITHERDKGNIQHDKSKVFFKAYKDRDIKYDGLNSLRFVFEKRRLKPLYTWLLVNVLNDDTKIGLIVT